MPDDSELVASIVLCDGIIKEEGSGKLTLVGCFHALGALQFPLMHPGMTALISLTNFQTRTINFDVTVRLQDKTGLVLGNAGNHMEAEMFSNADVKSITVDVPVRFPPLYFSQVGVYTVVVLVDNEEVGKKSLPVFTPPQS